MESTGDPDAYFHSSLLSASASSRLAVVCSAVLVMSSSLHRDSSALALPVECLRRLLGVTSTELSLGDHIRNQE